MLEWFISFQLLHKTQKKHFAFKCAWKCEYGCGVILLLVWSSPPHNSHTLTLNVSCYRAQRSSVVYFAMMLSAMWLPPLRGEGNQPFHFQGRGSVQGLTPYFPPVVFKMFQPHSEPKPLFLLVGWLVGRITGPAAQYPSRFLLRFI